LTTTTGESHEKKKESLILEIFYRRLAPTMEPLSCRAKWGIVGQIPSRVELSPISGTTHLISTLWVVQGCKDKDYANFFMREMAIQLYRSSKVFFRISGLEQLVCLIETSMPHIRHARKIGFSSYR